MKKLLFFLLFACKEDFKNDVATKLKKPLQTVIDSYLDHGRDWNPKGYQYTIWLDYMDVRGFYTKSGNQVTIFVNPESENYVVTLFHEIGHMNGLRHGSCQLMENGNMQLQYSLWEWMSGQYIKEYFEAFYNEPG